MVERTDESRIVATYTRARYAEWAGDFAQCEADLSRLTKEFDTPSSFASIRSPLDIVLFRAGELLRRVAPMLEAARPPEGAIIQTRHFRGVIHQTGEREFELRGYLTDPEYEEVLRNLVDDLLPGRRALQNEHFQRQERRVSTLR